MIDTLGLNIPLDEEVWRRLHEVTMLGDEWQWVRFQGSTGEIKQFKLRGSLNVEEGSYQRDIIWSLPSEWNSVNTFLSLELSIPKLWYGHNIYLLFDFLPALNVLRRGIQKKFKIVLPEVINWQLSRADICYAFKCPNQELAQAILDSLKNVHYPRTKAQKYDTTLLFPGKTFSFKFYLKYPEFLKNDKPKLIDLNYRKEKIDSLEDLAKGVIRIEATLRRRYLRRYGIETVGDLLKTMWTITLVTGESTVQKVVHESRFDISRLVRKLEGVSDGNIGIESRETLDLMRLEMYPIIDEMTQPENLGDHRTGDIIINLTQTSVLTYLLNRFLERFIGTHKMENIEAIKQKLIETFKPHKAARLLGFWMHVQRFGTVDAKQFFGQDSFYRSKRELKELGISLVEPPKVIDARDRFLKNFTFTVPSEHAVNLRNIARDLNDVVEIPPEITEQ